MLDAVLSKKSLKIRLTVKGAVSILCVVLAVALPQIAHAVGGSSAGAVYMPMYMPALLAGCLLGWQWGLGVGIMSPIVSFAFTSLALGSAMPTASRLPYMILELAAFGGISGLFAKLIQKNVFMSFPAVLAAQLSGRVIYVVYNLIAGRDFATLWSSVQTSLTGLYMQAIIVPVFVIVLSKLLKREREENE
jgi:hypothetical protein